jgi:hypothetical protein
MRELLILSAPMCIGRKSVDLGIAFVKRSVLALQFKQEGLKLTERPALNGRASFGDQSRGA